MDKKLSTQLEKLLKPLKLFEVLMYVCYHWSVLYQRYRNHRDILGALGRAVIDEDSSVATLWPLWTSVERERLALSSAVSALFPQHIIRGLFYPWNIK